MNTNEKMRSHFVAIHDELKKYLAKEINDTSLCLRIKNIVNDALVIPRRNCDVGDVDDQDERFERFCDAHKYVGDDGTNMCLRDCPCFNMVDCGVYWSQMPYDEGK